MNWIYPLAMLNRVFRLTWLRHKRKMDKKRICLYLKSCISFSVFLFVFFWKLLFFLPLHCYACYKHFFYLFNSFWFMFCLRNWNTHQHFRIFFGSVWPNEDEKKLGKKCGRNEEWSLVFFFFLWKSFLCLCVLLHKMLFAIISNVISFCV